jgi:hypothetical protein
MSIFKKRGDKSNCGDSAVKKGRLVNQHTRAHKSCAVRVGLIFMAAAGVALAEAAAASHPSCPRIFRVLLNLLLALSFLRIYPPDLGIPSVTPTGND